MVTLGYHRCPMLCGLVLDGLAKALKAAGLTLGKDHTAVDVSIDPDEDINLARQQKRSLRVDRAGRQRRARRGLAVLVTGEDAGRGRRGGSRDARGLSLQVRRAEPKQFAHDAVAFVLTPDGTIARYLYGVDYPPRDVRLALVEASGGRVGTSFDKVLLSCYRYDPVTGSTRPYVFGFMRIGAGLVFLALGRSADRPVAKEIADDGRRSAA